MAISDPEVIRFTNEQLRPAMDSVGRAYYRVKRMIDIYQSKVLADKIANDVGEIIADGSDVDGRSRLSGAGVRRIMDSIAGVISALETVDNATGYTLIHGVLNAAVNVD